ncbi:MAG: hypothetical protein ACRDPO_22150 [Streptosporangiaceae bacterium]
MSSAAEAVLLAVFILASCIWVGGYVAIAVVARTAATVLESRQRIAFFRSLGRTYLLVGVPALLVALGTGAGLLSRHRWDGTVGAAVLAALALVSCLTVAVVQARRMTRLRRCALAAPADAGLALRVSQGARAAAVLRATIGAISLTLIVLGSFLAT